MNIIISFSTLNDLMKGTEEYIESVGVPESEEIQKEIDRYNAALSYAANAVHATMQNGAELCSRCEENHAEQLHTCPYQVEIHGNDGLCDCCVECVGECQLDI